METTVVKLYKCHHCEKSFNQGGNRKSMKGHRLVSSPTNVSIKRKYSVTQEARKDMN